MGGREGEGREGAGREASVEVVAEQAAWAGQEAGAAAPGELPVCRGIGRGRGHSMQGGTHAVIWGAIRSKKGPRQPSLILAFDWTSDGCNACSCCRKGFVYC